MRGVLGQSAEANLHQPELALDDSERVLDLCAHAGLAVLALASRRFVALVGQLGDVARASSDVPLQILASSQEMSKNLSDGKKRSRGGARMLKNAQVRGLFILLSCDVRPPKRSPPRECPQRAHASDGRFWPSTVGQRH